MDTQTSVSCNPFWLWLELMRHGQEFYRGLGRAAIEMHSALLGRYAYEAFPQYFRDASPARPFESLRVGERAERTTEVTPEKVLYFARAVGDWQELHFDRKFAAGTRFKEPIAHGMLVNAFVLPLLSADLPGRGTIHMFQACSFRAPVYIGDQITTSAVIILIEPNRTVTLRVEAKNQKGETVLDGEAVVKAPK